MNKKFSKIVQNITSKYNTSIRNKIFIFFTILVIVPVFFISIALYQKSRSIINNNFSSTVIRDLSVAETNIKMKLSSVYETMISICLDPKVVEILSKDTQVTFRFPVNQVEIIEEISSLNQVLERFSQNDISKNNIIPRLYIYNKPEYNINRFSNNVYDLQDVKSESWYKTIGKNNTFDTCGLKKSANSYGAFDSILLAKKLYGLKNRDFNFAGIMTVEVPVEDFYYIFDAFNPSENSQIMLVDDNDIILLSKDHSLVGSSIKEKVYYKELKNRSAEELYNYKIKEDRIDKLMFTIKIPEYNWTIIAISPVNDLISQLKDFNRMIVPIVLIWIMIATLYAFIISNNISYPIRKLVKAMSHIGEGNFEVMIEYNRNDEFSILINTFKKMMNKMNGLIQKLYVSELQKKEAELNALQAQINPHFLYNTLDSVNWLALKHKVPEISKMVKALSNLFRFSLSKGKNIITLYEEKMQIDSYLTILKIRFNDKLNYTLDFPDHLQEYITIKLILQPIVENAVIHGIEKSEIPGKIDITVLEQSDSLMIIVSDNGVGADVDELNAYLSAIDTKGKSYGIINVHKRIQQYFGEEYGVNYINNEPRGITAVIKIPKLKTMEDAYVNNGDS